jgi:hypothetical protein
LAITEAKSGKCQLPLLANDFAKALIAAGVLAEGCLYRKVTITCTPWDVVTIDVELEADHRLLRLVRAIAKETPGGDQAQPA